MKKTDSKTTRDSGHTSSLTLGESEEKHFFGGLSRSYRPFFGPDTIQPQLRIGQPGDEYEREADYIADQVMRMPDPVVQRQPEEEEELQMKRLPELQKRSEASSDGNGFATTDLNHRLQSQKGSGNYLPGKVKSEMEGKIGADFSGVQIHTDSEAREMSRQLGARAFTHGRDIYFNKGEYDPTSNDGKRLLAHELAHVVQQNSDAAVRNSAKKSGQQNTLHRSFGNNSSIIQCSIISEMRPEAIFIEEYLDEIQPTFITDNIPASSILRRHEPFDEQLDPFISDYNQFVAQSYLTFASINNLKSLIEDSALSPDPSRVISGNDREVIQNADADTVDRAAEIEGRSVTVSLDNIRIVRHRVLAARAELIAAQSALEILRVRAEREGAEEEVQRIEAQIQEVSEMATIATSIVTTLAAGPAATSSAISTYARNQLASAPPEILSAIHRLAFSEQLSTLKNRIERLTEREETLINTEVEARLTTAQASLHEVSEEQIRSIHQLEESTTQRRNQFFSIGNRLDEQTGDDSSTRYQYILSIAASVQEVEVILNHTLSIINSSPGIEAFLETYRENGLGFPGGQQPNSPDIGQAIIAQHLNELYSFAEWSRRNRPIIERWAEAWREVVSMIGRPSRGSSAGITPPLY